MFTAPALLLAAPAAGQTVEVKVCARSHWTPTGLTVRPGDQLWFESRGVWHDAQNDATAAGYSQPLFAPVFWLRRQPFARWFELIACVGENRCFRPQQRQPVSVQATGPLYLYPNDIAFLYGNNRGHIRVTVTRAAAGAPRPSGPAERLDRVCPEERTPGR